MADASDDQRDDERDDQHVEPRDDERVEPSARPWRRRVVLATRFLGLAVVIVLVVRQSDRIASAWQLLRASSLPYWLLAAVLQLVSLFVATVRLSVIVRAVGHRIGVVGLFLDLVAATALNAALLMGVGDVYRVQRINRDIGSLGTSSASVLLDRLLGLGTVCAVAALASIWLSNQGSIGVDVRWPIAVAVLGALAAGALWLLRERLPVAAAISRPFVALLGRPSYLAAVALLSLTVVALWVASIISVAHGLGITVEPLVLVFAAPVVTIATLLPISIGGIGVREAGYALLLAPHGVAVAAAIALGVAQYSLLLPVIAVGAVILWRRRS